MLPNLNEEFSTDTGRMSHSEWISSLMTTKVVAEARKFLTPTALSSGAHMDKDALYNYGVQVGMYAMLDIITRLPDYAAGLAAMKSQQEEPKADFAPETILDYLVGGTSKPGAKKTTTKEE